MSNCPVCGDSSPFVFVERERVPVTQNLILPSSQAAREIARGSLAMCCCESCGFAFNRDFDASLVGYGDAYDNTQSHSPSFKAYMDELVDHLITRRGVRGARVVEVGCGKGYFLRTLIERSGGENVGWGFDPSYVGPTTELDGKLAFERCYYGPMHASLEADVVVCRHVIEHVAEPLALLATVRAALVNSPNARVFFETPSLEWILQNLVMWDFFYEHCSLFSKPALATAFERAGFEVTEIATTFGGQYLWLEATLANSSARPRGPGALPELARRFSREERQWLEFWRRRLGSTNDKLAIWGAGAKGVTFANLVDETCERIDCVVDLNPHKQGCFLPGTGHPIVAPQALGEREVRTAILMNPNYREENESLLRTLGLEVTLEDQHV